MSYKIGAIQAQDIQGNTTASLKVIRQAMSLADNENIDILCFPECFLQGYTLDHSETEDRALNLEWPEFKEMLNSIKQYNVTIILGLIEKDEDSYYNTAAVIKHGEIIGIYRKVHLFEHNFQAGKSYPTFTVDGLTFGINICYDARFSEGAAALSKQGAKVIFYPLNNRLPTEKAINYRNKHIPNLVERAKESGCWIVSSDVTAQDSTHTGYGCTAIVDPMGEVVSQVAELASSITTLEVE
jgi:predicted amidohydrolase